MIVVSGAKMLNRPVYLDYNASTPVDPRVLEAMLPWFRDHFGNPSSSHAPGRLAAEAVDRARRQVADLIRAQGEEIVFTSGATESCNLAVHGVARHYAVKGRHIVTALHEHRAVLDPCRRLEQQGYAVTWLRPSTDGIIDPADVAAALRDDTLLVSVHWANNETGAVNDVAAIGRICKERGVLLHTDATQWLGRGVTDVEGAGIDLLSGSAHKLYGPKGAGFLYVRSRRPRVRVEPLIEGGGQEAGLRSGTLNVPGIVGLGAAAELAGQSWPLEMPRQGALRDRLEAQITQALGDRIVVNSPPASRTANTWNISVRGVDPGPDGLPARLPGLAVSSASACHTGSRQPSHVLKAMGRPDDLALASLRFSLGRPTTADEVEIAISYVVDVFRR